MALTPDEQQQLDALTAKAAEKDEDDDEIEVWKGDTGARLRGSKAKKWLQEQGFIPADEPAPEPEGDGKPAAKGKPAVKPRASTPQRYFGKK